MQVKDLKKSIFNLKKNTFYLSLIEIKQEQLEAEILPEEFEKYKEIFNLHRKKEFQYVRYLRNINIGHQTILYEASGKPVIKKNGVFISISHSKKFAALAHADFQIGIDIEELSPRILKVWSRYLHPEEFAIFDTTSIFDLTIAWTIKEALFKLNTKTDIDFKNDLRIKSKEGNTFLCEMKSKDGFQTVKMETLAHKNLIISYNINQ